MSVAEELEYCLLYYPSIFPNKFAVYHHWFAVNGNGYAWRKGELVDSYEQKKRDMEMTVEAAIKHAQARTATRILQEKEQHGDISDFSLKFYMDDLEKTVNRIKDYENRKEDFSSKRGSLYPLCQYACIVNTPNNIKSDWLDAVSEFKAFLNENYVYLNDNDKLWIDRINMKVDDDIYIKDKADNKYYGVIKSIKGAIVTATFGTDETQEYHKKDLFI